VPFHRAGVRRVPEQRAKPARVGKPHDPARQRDVDMIVTARRWHRAARPDPPRARHAEMRDQGAMLEFPQQILAAATQPPDAPVAQLLRQVARDRPAQPELAHFDRNHAFALGNSGSSGMEFRRTGKDRSDNVG